MQTDIQAIVILLAVFTIAIANVPMDSFIAALLKRHPSTRDIRRMKNMWLVISVICLALLVYYVVKIVSDFALSFLVFIKPLHLNIGFVILIGLGITFVVLGLIYLVIWYIRRTVDRLTRRDEEVERIAYELWEKEGRPNNRALEHWTRAEAIWKEQRKK